jgi:hypothetical protein
MGFLNLFFRKKNQKNVFQEYVKEILSIIGKKQSSVNRVKMTAILSMSAIAQVSVRISDGKEASSSELAMIRHLLNEIEKSAVDSIVDIEKVKIRELSISEEEDMSRILSDFPWGPKKNAVTNGMRAYEAIFKGNGENFLAEIPLSRDMNSAVKCQTAYKMASAFGFKKPFSKKIFSRILKSLEDMSVALLKASEFK